MTIHKFGSMFYELLAEINYTQDTLEAEFPRSENVKPETEDTKHNTRQVNHEDMK